MTDEKREEDDQTEEEIFVEEIESKSTLDRVMGAETPIVIDFWAPWCGPCKAMAPQFEAVAEQYADEDVGFYKLNTEDHPGLSKIFNIRSIPTVIFAHEGEVLDSNVGAIDAHRLAKKVDWLMSKARGESFLDRLFKK